MRIELYCANCGKLLEDEAYMFHDNFLQIKYFDDNKSNRFCSQDCACEALMLTCVEKDDLPLDEYEEEEERNLLEEEDTEEDAYEQAMNQQALELGDPNTGAL